MKTNQINKLFKEYKETSLFGRYITTNHITPLIEKQTSFLTVNIVGESVLGDNIYSLTIGSGSKKILMWSQMHGNESTTTKAIFDLLNTFINTKNELINAILNTCTIKIIPILNPDGAKLYTRFNANKVDLNRDAQDLFQPESVALRTVYNKFKPDFCFNLHGQRTIFSAGTINKPATLSFLSPAQDKNTTLTNNRKIAMAIIAKMYNALQVEIPKQIGVYDDAFNINCVGDTFQSFNTPTVLFEAGHYKNDYSREEVRRYMYIALFEAINSIAKNNISSNDYKKYLKIPENEKLFFDIIIKNVKINNTILDVAIQYQEKLIDKNVKFVPKIEKIDDLSKFHAHKTINANNSEVFSGKKQSLKVGDEIDFVLINNEKNSLKIAEY